MDKKERQPKFRTRTLYSKAKRQEIDPTLSKNKKYTAECMKAIVADPENEEDVGEQTTVWQPQDDEMLKKAVHDVVTQQMKREGEVKPVKPVKPVTPWYMTCRVMTT